MGTLLVRQVSLGLVGASYPMELLPEESVPRDSQTAGAPSLYEQLLRSRAILHGVIAYTYTGLASSGNTL